MHGAVESQSDSLPSVQMPLLNRRLSRFLVSTHLYTLALFVLFASAIALRIVAMDRFPGISGDEAVNSVMTLEALAGQPTSWRFPTGRTLSPLMAGLLATSGTLFPHTVWALRLPALCVGLVLIFFSLHLLPNVIGRRAALYATILIACLPIHIAYCRTSIEESLLGLCALLCLYFGIKRHWVGLVSMLTVSLLVHQLSVFFIPLLFFLVVPPFALSQWQPQKLLAIVGVAILFGMTAIWFTPSRYLQLDWLWIELKNPSTYPDFLWHFVKTFSGTTVIEDFAGPIGKPAKEFFDGLIGTLLIGVLCLGTRALFRNPSQQGKSLWWAWLAMMLVFFVFAGRAALYPGLQRYSLTITIPTLILFSVLIDALTKNRPNLGKWGVLLSGLALLTFFYQTYLLRFYRTGGESHSFYQSGAEEPKWALWERLKEETSPGSPINVVAEDWWSYWPLRYFSHGSNRFHILRLKEDLKELPNLIHWIERGGIAVGFPNGILEKTFQETRLIHHLERRDSYSPSGKPLFSAWQLKRKSPR